jgi:predicted dienelactone hydrolase
VIHPRRFLLALIGLLAASVSFAGQGPQNFELAGLKVAAWIPDTATPGPWPVVLFSHGFHGCNTQSEFLMEGLAKAGYAVFAPNHRDATCSGGDSSWLDRPDGQFRDAAQWTDATFADRAQDLKNLLDALNADPRFDSVAFDWQHVALAGHSLGGYTVLELAGAWHRWKDGRVKAVLALSPYCAPFIERQTLAGIDMPVMYQRGTLDFGITPFIRKPGGAYDQTPRPKYFVEFDGAAHFAWTDLRATYHEAIIAYAHGFFDHALKGKPFPPDLAAPHDGVAEVRIAE